MTRIILHYARGFILPLVVDETRPFNAILADAHEIAESWGRSSHDYLTCEIPEQPQGLRPIKVQTDRLEARAWANRA